MKIKFLGTGFGAPTAERHCQSMLLETEAGNAYLIDAGAPVIEILVKDGYDMSKIKAIFLTHLHGDHMNGLFDIQYFAGYYGIKCGVYLAEQAGLQLMQDYFKLQSGGEGVNNLFYHLIREGVFFEEEELKVRAFRTSHAKVSYGFELEADGEKICITGDLTESLEDFPILAEREPLDLLIVECTHFPAKKLLEKLKNVKAVKVAFVHVWPLANYDELKVYAGSAPFGMLFPEDGELVPAGTVPGEALTKE